MTDGQMLVVVGMAVVAWLATIVGWRAVFREAKSFGETRFLGWLGIFVWGDAVIIGPLWLVMSVIAWWQQDWWLFLMEVAVFWVVRSLGETIYWINQQFSVRKRNPPENLWGYQWVKSEAIWFMYQLFWQGITVMAVIAGLYIGRRWLY